MRDKKQILSELIGSAVAGLARGKGVSLPEGFTVLLERPKREGHGDWATNVCMQIAKLFGSSPRDFAVELSACIQKGEVIENIDIAGPGFMNFTLTANWISDVLQEVLEKKEHYGRNNKGEGQRVQVEFVSANPTGPIHLGHGRGAAVGDILSSVLSFSGWDVSREYYINDAGLQMDMLGQSTQSRYFDLIGRGGEAPFPENGYPGEYIDGIAAEILKKHGTVLVEKTLEESLPLFRDETADRVLEMIRRDLEAFGVDFDVWFSEKSLYDGDLVERTIARLKEGGYAYEQDGAIWFRSTLFGDDKDRVMIRANGIPTYFTSDVAYLQNKYERGFDKLIYVWGADHHGYIPRLRSVNKTLGAKDEAFHVLLIQFVSLMRNGVPVAMSKRAGSFVTLREVVEEVGADATRFFFVMRRNDSHLDFDLELAKRSSSDNPVFYVQYAHARICSILREVESRGISIPPLEELDVAALSEPSEQALVKAISRFPEEVIKAADELAPHRIAFYAQELAEAFHYFYNEQRVLGVEKDKMNARLLLVEATRITLRNVLGLLRISAPERM